MARDRFGRFADPYEYPSGDSGCLPLLSVPLLLACFMGGGWLVTLGKNPSLGQAIIAAIYILWSGRRAFRERE